MPFSHRVFCQETALPSLSEVLVWLRQHEYPVKLAGGRSSGDLLSSFWDQLAFSVADAEPPLILTCVRADAAGMTRLGEEVADFVADVEELPASDGRARVLEHLGATRALVIIEFGPDGGSTRAHDTAESIATLLVERARGMAQRDGQGFLDEDDELILTLG